MTFENINFIKPNAEFDKSDAAYAPMFRKTLVIDEEIETADGFPSYNCWLEDGATTLYERWNMTESMNHHMYSYFMAWLMHTVLGIETDEKHPGFERLDIHPHFFDGLDFAEGCCDTVRGLVAVRWERNDGKVRLSIDVPPAMDAYYKKKA